MLSHLIQKLLGAGFDQKLKNYLIKGSFWSFLLQIALTFITLLTSLLMARWAGDANFGAYSVVSNWVFLLSMAGLAGADDLLLKQLPIYQQSNDQQGQARLFFWALYRILGWTAALGLLFGLLVYSGWLPSWSQNAELFYLGLLMLLIINGMWLIQSVFKGLKQLGRGQLGEKFIQPISFLLLLLVGLPLMSLGSWELLTFRLLSYCCALGLLIWLFYPIGKQFFAQKPVDNPDKTEWNRTGFYFMLSTLLFALNSRADLAFLDIFGVEFADIAHYNAAARLADLLNMPFMVMATVASPLFAQFYHQKEPAKLQKLFVQSSLVAFGLTLMGFLLICWLGRWLLGWFGAGFESGYELLILFGLARLLHAFFGPTNYLLMMCGREREGSYSLMLSVLVSFVLQAWLIPKMGAAGAAWANLWAFLAFELLQSWILSRYLGLKPWIFAIFEKKNHL